jgi:hypothetical protein
MKTVQFIYFLSLEQMLVEHFNKKRISFPIPYLYIPKLWNSNSDFILIKFHLFFVKEKFLSLQRKFQSNEEANTFLLLYLERWERHLQTIKKQKIQI